MLDLLLILEKKRNVKVASLPAKVSDVPFSFLWLSYKYCKHVHEHTVKALEKRVKNTLSTIMTIVCMRVRICVVPWRSQNRLTL